MRSAVKTKSLLQEPFPSSPPSVLWLVYFLLTIGIVGASTAYALSVPLFVLSWVFPSVAPVADRVLCFGIGLLMRVQPWFRCEGELPSERPETGPGQKGHLWVSNHRSHLDSFILLSRIPGIRILAKRSLFSVPFLGWMMRLSRHIAVERNHLPSFWQAMGRVRSYLQAGEIVHIFPEMTRCEAGFGGLMEFSLAPFHLAIQESVRIYPIVFVGTDRAWPKGGWGIRPFEPIRLCSLLPVEASRFTSAEALRQEVKTRMETAFYRSL